MAPDMRNLNSRYANKIFMIDNDGNELEVEGTLSFVEQENSDLSIDAAISSVTNNSFTFELKNIKPLSRKKFIKLLMSKGINRNGANEMAKYTLKKYGKYDYTSLFYF